MFIDGMTRIGLGHITKRFVRCLSGNNDDGDPESTSSGVGGIGRKRHGSTRGGRGRSKRAPSAGKQNRTVGNGKSKKRPRKKKKTTTWESALVDSSHTTTDDDDSIELSGSDHLPVGALESGVSNEAQAVRDSVNAHEVLKFIGRDCRALEHGYKKLLQSLNPTSYRRYRLNSYTCAVVLSMWSFTQL